MAFCQSCGMKLEEGAQFCPGCGTKVGSSTSSDDGSKRKQVFEGNIRKCPSCGTPLQAFQAICPGCGYELRNTAETSAIKEFAKKLDEIESSASEETNTAASVLSAYGISGTNKTANRKASYIASFAVPNDRESLTEFFILASESIEPSQAYKLFPNGLSGMTMGEIKAQKLIAKAWIAKFESLYKKAKLSFGTDASFSTIQSIYDDKMKAIKKAKMMGFWPIWIIIGFFVLPSGYYGIAARVENGRKYKERTRLEEIVQEIDKNIEAKDYDSALLNASKIQWSYEPDNFKTETQSWNEKRENLTTTIKELEGKKK